MIATASPRELLAACARAGASVVFDRGQLFIEPTGRISGELREALRANRDALLELLTPKALAAGGRGRDIDSPRAASIVETAKAMFSEWGPVEVSNVSTRRWNRDGVAIILRQLRRAGDRRGAIAIRDSWRERVAIVTIDAGATLERAEKIAFEQVKQAAADRGLATPAKWGSRP